MKKSEILKALKLDESKLKAILEANSDDEIEGVETFEVYTESEKNTLLKTHGDTKYKEATDVVSKRLAKELAALAGVETESKDPKEVYNLIQSKHKEAFGKPADEKVRELEMKLQTVSRSLEEQTQATETLKRQHKQTLLDTEIISKIPNWNTPGVKKNEWANVIKSNFNIEHTDDGIIYKRGAEELRDKKTGRPLTTEEVIGIFATERGLSEQQQHPTPGSNKTWVPGDGKTYVNINSKEDFYEAFKAAYPGKHPNGIEAGKFLNEVKAVKPDIIEILNAD